MNAITELNSMTNNHGAIQTEATPTTTTANFTTDGTGTSSTTETETTTQVWETRGETTPNATAYAERAGLPIISETDWFFDW